MSERTGERLERVNLVLSSADRRWLDQLTGELRASNGAAVSRSEITRAGLGILRALQKAYPQLLLQCRSGDDIELVCISAMKLASLRTEELHNGVGR
jgi:hypothetical protein